MYDAPIGLLWKQGINDLIVWLVSLEDLGECRPFIDQMVELMLPCRTPASARSTGETEFHTVEQKKLLDTKD